MTDAGRWTPSLWSRLTPINVTRRRDTDVDLLTLPRGGGLARIPKWVPNGLYEKNPSLVLQFLDLLETVESEAARRRQAGERWSRRGVLLGAGGALGAGTGGVAALGAGSANGFVTTLLAVIAFAGAAAAAAAGTLRAPERAIAEEKSAAQLESVARRLRAMITVDLQVSLEAGDAGQLLRNALDTVDAIAGVEVPEGLREMPRSKSRSTEENPSSPAELS